MKILTLRKKIITNLTLSGLLLVVTGLVVYYDIHKKKSTGDKAEKIKSEISNLRGRYTDLQLKAAEATKYQQIWKTIAPNRRVVSNVKIDDINSLLATIAEKYNIIKPVIKIIIPDNVSGGIFNRSTVTVAMSAGNLTFEAISDTKALSFISEFLNSIPGYGVVTNIDLKKAKKYTTQDLIDISSGKGSGAVIAKVDFYWYIYKPKTEKSQ